VGKCFCRYAPQQLSCLERLNCARNDTGLYWSRLSAMGVQEAADYLCFGDVRKSKCNCNVLVLHPLGEVIFLRLHSDP